jgi:hypothetical protein
VFHESGIFVELFAHTANDVVAVVAQLKEDETLGNIGLRGGSVGGFIVLAAIGLGEVVPIAGHCHLFDALAPSYRERPKDCLFVTHAGKHPTPTSLEHFGWTWLIEQIQ